MRYDPETISSIDVHVQICVTADKYDIQPLKMMAIAYFKQATSQDSIRCKGFSEAVAYAYNAPLATEEIRKDIAKCLIDNDILKMISEAEGSLFEQLMRGCAGQSPGEDMIQAKC